MLRSRCGLGRVLAAGLLVSLVMLAGCGDEETINAIADFRASSAKLTMAYQGLLMSANTVEEEQYIDGLSIHPAAFDEEAMKKLDVLTPEQVALRVAAMKALGGYTALLAELASGKASKALEPDTAAARVSVAALVADVQARVNPESGEKLAGPITAAAAAVGTVLKLIEQHRARKELRDSIAANDEAIQKLYTMIGEESRSLYARQKQALSDEQTAIVKAFDQEAATGVGGERMLSVGTRLKKVHREIALQEQANPKAAIAAWQKTHDALVELIKNGSSEKVTFTSLLADARRFAAEVEPLFRSVQAFVASL